MYWFCDDVCFWGSKINALIFYFGIIAGRKVNLVGNFGVGPSDDWSYSKVTYSQYVKRMLY